MRPPTRAPSLQRHTRPGGDVTPRASSAGKCTRPAALHAFRLAKIVFVPIFALLVYWLIDWLCGTCAGTRQPPRPGGATGGAVRRHAGNVVSNLRAIRSSPGGPEAGPARLTRPFHAARGCPVRRWRVGATRRRNAYPALERVILGDVVGVPRPSWDPPCCPDHAAQPGAGTRGVHLAPQITSVGMPK